MTGCWRQNLQSNLNIDKQILHNLHFNYILTGIDNVLDIPCVILARIDSSQDYILQADLSWHI